MLGIAVLMLAAVMSAAFGGCLILDPDRLDAWMGITAASPAGRTELRAVYGGCELGLALFLVTCAWRSRWTDAGLFAVAALHYGKITGRVVGFVHDGSATSTSLAYLLLELAFAGMATLALIRSPAPATASS